MPSVMVGQALYARLPARTVIGSETFTFAMTPERRAVLSVQRELDDGE